MKRFLERVNVLLHSKPALRHPHTTAIVLAGGNGNRMGSRTPKQWLEIRGVPVLIHSLRAFDNCRSIDEIIVVSRGEDLPATEILCRNHEIRKLKCVVSGGRTRADSARRGFAAISDKTEYVAIHDAARCMITPSQIREVTAAAYAYRAASAGTPVTDTIKKVNRYGMIEHDVPRADLWAMATPQVFHKVYYAAGLKAAADARAEVTDDNAFMELIGQRVKLVDTGVENFKITYETDLIRAEVILRAREEKHGK